MNANEQRVWHIEVLRGMIASRCYTQDACHAMEAGIQALAQQVPAERLQDVTLAERLRALHARLDAKLGAGFIDDIPGDELSAIREAAAALSVRGWLPIESAPKDGAEIFGWSENTGYDIVVFSGHGWQVAAYGYSREPTHWQPLPATPPSEG